MHTHNDNPLLRRRGNTSPHHVVLRFIMALMKNRLVLLGMLLVVYILYFATSYEVGTTSGSSILAVNHNLTSIIVTAKEGSEISPTDSTVRSQKNNNNNNNNIDNTYHAASTTTTRISTVNDSKVKEQDISSSSSSSLPVIYSYARGDRSGAAIQDMLMCHAYAYHHKLRYGGACNRDWTQSHFKGALSDRTRLLKAVGLDDALPIDCPPKDSGISISERYNYIQNDTMIFTKDYQDYLHSLVKYPPPPEEARKNAGPSSSSSSSSLLFRIAVHIRRGDITPCRPRARGYPRYLPNQHFLKLIDRYSNKNNKNDDDKNTRVVIYSESESFESFEVFRERGYEVVLDGDIGVVWQGLLSSDVAILSRSSFSLVPAVMSKGKVVYTPFWHEPLPNWDVVDYKLLNETHKEFRRLKDTCPKKNKNKKNKK